MLTPSTYSQIGSCEPTVTQMWRSPGKTKRRHGHIMMLVEEARLGKAVWFVLVQRGQEGDVRSYRYRARWNFGTCFVSHRIGRAEQSC